MAYVLVARCTDEQSRTHVERLEALSERSRPIRADTFFRHVSRRMVSTLLGYAYRRKGLTIRKDRCVGYYKSVWRGVPCYYLDWSRIEHIFVENDKLNCMR